jgi:uncharacterized Zn finger protein (UPF0148 family)
MIDATCPKCGRRFGWQGKMVDRPDCTCGHNFPKAELEAADAELEKSMKELAAQLKAETDALVGEAKQAYVSGRLAALESQSTDIAPKSTPYDGTEFRRFYVRGWRAGQGEKP